MKRSVVMPVFNEAATIRQAVQRLVQNIRVCDAGYDVH